MNLPRLVAAALVSVLVAASESSQEAAGREPAARRRSVLFYLMDTCRHDRVGYGRYERKTTPFLEWLAERSVVFETCYSQAPWTKPSMASMLTSRYPSTTGVYRMDQRLADDFLTWPEVLQANGLYTAGFSTNIVMGNSLSNFAQGFDHFVEGTFINRGDAINFASGSARKLNEHAFAWLDKSEHWPLLLYMHSVDPHEEYEPAREYMELFADMERDPQFREDWQKLLRSRPPIPGLYVTQDNFDRTEVDPAPFIEHASNLYDADILANDDQMQRLWDKLQEKGWGEDFIFVFTSDHGEEFFEHGATSHGYSLYDEMIRVPLMIYAPGLLPGGKRIDSPVRSLDIYPTLCELLGFEVEEGLQGTSLLPLIRGQAGAATPEIFSEHREDPVLRAMGYGSGVMVSLRSGNWKFILNIEGSQLLDRPRYELYDLEADPGERKNVATAHPEIVKRFESKAIAFVSGQSEAKSELAAADPAALEQLRALGYVGEEEDEADIWVALESRDFGRIKRALREGASPNQVEPTTGLRPLAMAALVGNIELAQLLLKEGAKINLANRDGSTPLSSAAFLGRVDMLAFLLEAGADTTLKSLVGDTALGATEVPWEFAQYVAKLLKIPLERKSVEEGRKRCAELLRKASESGGSPTTRLFESIRAGDAEALELALAAGADLEQLDPEKGWTPLSSAVFLGHEELVGLLLAKGCKVHTPNKDGGTALHLAALMDRVALVELLIDEGAVIDARDGQGSTPLHSAAFLGRVTAVELLLEEQADRNLKKKDGLTPLQTAQVDWPITEFILRLLGLELRREDVEEGRLAVARLLSE